MAKINTLIPYQEFLRQEEELRPYLGMSQLGHSCSRLLWYSLRWAYTRTLLPRNRRIFERGNIEEPRVIRDLTDWKYKITDTQLEFIGPYGHVKGHCDGIVLGFTSNRPAILEIKTMKNSEWIKLNSKPFTEVAPSYYVQGIVYAYYAELDDIIFVVSNKDTEARKYIHIKANHEKAKEYVQKAEDILLAESPPTKIGGPSWYVCSYCPAKDICHYGEPVKVTCRMCEHAELHTEGRWYCGKKNEYRTLDEQREACKEFKAISV